MASLTPPGAPAVRDDVAPSRPESPVPRVAWWLGLRVWLALAFALVVVITVVTVARVFLTPFEETFRNRAQDLAAGSTVEAAMEVIDADRRGADLDQAVQEGAFAPLFVFDEDGRLLTWGRSQGVALSSVRGHEEALATALAGSRYVEGVGNDATLVALPLDGERASAIVAYARHPELASGVGIAREKILSAALWALFVGALIALLVAALIAYRLRRITACAVEIERGNFDRPLVARFPDEIGMLAATFDRMRTRLRESFDTLASERNRLGQLLERLHEGVVTVDRELRVDFANEAARRLLGPSRVGKGERLPEAWRAFALGEFAAGLFAPDAEPTSAHVPVDDQRTYALVGVPARGADNAILVVTDVSEQERRERAERQFVTNAAHELRTPLQTILGAVEALEAGADQDPEQRRRFLGHLRRESSRLGRLTRALLLLARAQTREGALDLRPVELQPILADVAASVSPREGVELVVECPPDVVVRADADLAVQLVSNLAENAAKHTNAGTIALRAIPLASGDVAIDVADTGPGISGEHEERIFDRFYRGSRRNGDGFGLGLSIVREIARALGGRLEFASEPNVGTTVRIVLPAAHRDHA